MSNVYALDFLRQEHVLDEVGSGRNSRYSSSHHKNSNNDDDDDDDRDTIDIEALAAAAANKPDLEKQHDIMNFLKAHRSAGMMSPTVIFQRTGIDLEEDTKVAQMLMNNNKINVETVPDPENPVLTIDTYAYQATYNHVRDRKTLLAQINTSKDGVLMKELEDSYDTVQDDLDALICAGDVLGLFNTERKDKVLFPRGEPFLVELDGILTIPAEKKQQKENHDAIGTGNGNGNGVAGTIGAATSTSTANGAAKTEPTASNSSANGNASAAPDDASSLSKEKNTALSLAARPVYCVETDSNPVTQIRRGEAVQIGGTWFRVSSDVKGHSKNQPVRARAPLSVVARRDIALSKNNKLDGFMQPFTSRVLPADAPLPPSAIENLRKAKEAREKLLKLAHGIRAGGASSQLLGTNAHSSNPVALASTLGTTHALGSRRRPQAGSGVGAASSASARAAAQEAMAKLKEAALDPYLSLYSHPRRHGCTKDVRELYLGTRSKVPDMDNKLRDELVEHKLLDPGEEMRRVRLQKRSNVDNDGKPKKRRYYERKNQRMTNTHLEGTEIGSLLKKATEKQQQGQAVGDGGM